jgi:hypothetical protein
MCCTLHVISSPTFDTTASSRHVILLLYRHTTMGQKIKSCDVQLLSCAIVMFPVQQQHCCCHRFKYDREMAAAVKLSLTRQAMYYNVTIRCLRETIVAVEKKVLDICLCACACVRVGTWRRGCVHYVRACVRAALLIQHDMRIRYIVT